MQVRPEYSAADLLGDLEQMMMVVPINTEINETEDVTQQYRQDRFQRGKFNRMRYLQFQHHNRDDDGKDTVAEGFKSGCFHFRTPDSWLALFIQTQLPSTVFSRADPSLRSLFGSSLSRKDAHLPTFGQKRQC